MSYSLYTSDNMSVKGYSYKAPTYQKPTDDQATEQEVLVDAVHLDFTLMINGKLKTFGYSFVVEKEADAWTLVDWVSWNSIYFVLAHLGYAIDGNEYSFGQGTMRTWINTIMK